MMISTFARLTRHWLCLVLLWSIAGSAQAAAPTSLDGLWKGPLKMPGGELEVVFRLVSLTGGEYFATLDVPQQRVSRMAVQVQVHGDTVILAAEEAGSRFIGRLAAGGKQVTGTWYQPGHESSLTLSFSPAAINTAPKARLTPPYREEEVSYTNEQVNLKLGGTLTVPAGEGPFPAVVLVSDAGAHDRDATTGEYRPMGILADYLTRRGIAVLRFDDRGMGASAGDFSTTIASELVGDVQAGLKLLRNTPKIDTTHIGVIGHGEGGNVALLTASQPLPPAFVVTLAAYGLPGNQLVLEQQRTVLRAIGVKEVDVLAFSQQQQALQQVVLRTPDVKLAQTQLVKMMRANDANLDTLTAKNRAIDLTSFRYRSLLRFNPGILLNKVKCPVLLLNGTADLEVQADTNLDALSLALEKNMRVTRKKLFGVNHQFQADPANWALVNGQRQETFSPVALEAVRSWIVSHAK
ncbi:alpha/beta hydrolase family protein [Hymenobacter canadensis]|uniref:Alpha/beta hydrolase n=1 Tax=Hymenobacter canadensis TaxID=2999067 RepID=A0ABY7LM46_9BACT|nr:alpha/beta hydrolase [Hymenobacter canadensis]WBA41524.1 alpha/beta hydrolase [Hymenobacter canadensis]